MRAFLCLVVNLVILLPIVHVLSVGAPDYKARMSAAVVGGFLGWSLAYLMHVINQRS